MHPREKMHMTLPYRPVGGSIMEVVMVVVVVAVATVVVVIEAVIRLRLR